ncbi:hypothetical protein [Terasakiella pusilla]|uniref:hypothetical protein n=1 Tax=Terasakiella pusilla TaxID=64973 RepID=UPI003AA9279D
MNEMHQSMFDNLIGIVKALKSHPDTEFQRYFEDTVKYSDDGVMKSFFPPVLNMAKQNFSPDIAIDNFSVFLRKYAENNTVALEFQRAPAPEISVKYISYLVSTMTYHSFNQTIKLPSGTNGYNDLILKWFDDHGLKLGKYFIACYLCQKLSLSLVSNELNLLLGDIVKNTTTQAFTNGFMLEAFTSGTPLPVYALLDFTDFLDPTGKSGSEIIKAWQQNSYFQDLKDPRNHRWAATISGAFQEGSSNYDALFNPVLKLAQQQNSHVKTHFGAGTTTTTIYGEDLEKWIDSANGPSKYGLKSDKSAKNRSSSHTSPHHGH